MRKAIVAVMALLVAAAALTALAKDAPAGHSDVEIPTARGVKLHAVLHRPEKPNGAAVVLAPGKGNPPKSPILAICATRLAEAGFTVVHFDYAYFAVPDGKPADDLSTEIADMEAAIGYAKKLEGVSKVLLAGKSLGSVAALHWANAHPNDLAGLALLTFVVTADAKSDTPLEQAAELHDCPYEALVIDGKDDGYSVPRVLYEVGSKCKRAPQIVVVPGDHGFAPASKDEAETAENCELAAKAFVVWAKRTIAK